MKHLKQERGVLLVILVVFLVVASMAVTVALQNAVLSENQRRFVRTRQKMIAAQRGAGDSRFQISNESGTDMTYLNQTGTFPANMNAFVTAGFFKHFGLTSAQYAAALDGYGNPLVMSNVGTFIISSTSAGGPPAITVSQALYQNITTRIEVLDKDGSLRLGPGYLLVHGAPGSSGVYQVASASTVDLWALGDWDGQYFITTASVGNYEIRLMESDTILPDWMTIATGSSQIRVPLWISPVLNGSIITRQIRLPVDL